MARTALSTTPDTSTGTSAGSTIGSVAPLLITRDDDVLADIGRLAAAANVTPQVHLDPVAALTAWPAAPLVLIGADVAEEMAGLGPDRRDRAYVVCHDTAPHRLFETALRLGAESVVSLSHSEPWLVEVLTDAGDLRSTRGVVIGVIGGAGGAGATTFACALGQVVARRSPALLIDADFQGPGVDRVLGMEEVEGVRWESLIRTTGRLSARSLAEAVPRRDGLGVVSWGRERQGSMPAFAIREVLSAGARGHDHVILDLPRLGDPAVGEALSRCALVVVVVPGSVTGVASAAHVVARLPAGVNAGILIRGEQLTAREVSDAVGLPVLAMMRDQRGVTEAVDLGLGPVRSRRGALLRASNEVMESLDLRRTG